MTAKITDRLWSWNDVLARVDAANVTKPRGPYKTREAISKLRHYLDGEEVVYLA